MAENSTENKDKLILSLREELTATVFLLGCKASPNNKGEDNLPMYSKGE